MIVMSIGEEVANEVAVVAVGDRKVLQEVTKTDKRKGDAKTPFCVLVEIEDVLNRGVPVMVWDASVRRYVLLTPEEYYNKYDDRRSPRDERDRRYRDDYGRSRRR